MELTVLWFVFLTVLFAVFFILEGFDYGVGILLPVIGKNDAERQQVIHAIGPVWDGNQVWMITAGGAMFAAFPHAYATIFSGFYLPLLLILLALIVRGVGLEYRNKVSSPRWRGAWDWLVCGGSLLPALLWGVAITNLLQGVPINAHLQYAGTLFDLLSPYTLSGGLAFLTLFTFHGAVYLTLNLNAEMAARARLTALWAGAFTALCCLQLVALTYVKTTLFHNNGAGNTLWLALAAFAVSYWSVLRQHFARAFTLSSVTILLLTVAFFGGLFPHLVISSLNPAWSLTIYNAASSPYTLQLMTIAACVFLPLIIAYQVWVYWVLRKRANDKPAAY